MNMSENIAEYGHFRKIKFTQEEIDKFHEEKPENYDLELKRKVQKIFHDGGIEISLDEIFSD